MTISYLKNQCEIRKNYLLSQKLAFQQQLNHEAVNKIDSELLEIEETLAKLNTIN